MNYSFQPICTSFNLDLRKVKGEKALLIFKTIIEYNNNRGNKVFVTALDLT